MRRSEARKRLTFFLRPVHEGRQKCREAWPDPTVEIVFTVMLDLLLLVIPLAVMAFAYINITVTLRKGIRDNERPTNGERTFPVFSCSRGPADPQWV